MEITFIKNNQNEPKRSIKIFCLDSEKVGDIIEKYRIKADDKNKEEKFICNAKKLNPDLTVAEAGLIDQSRIFVMGDNRATSVDSRNTSVGCVAEEQIVGKIRFRVWPLSQMGVI